MGFIFWGRKEESELYFRASSISHCILFSCRVDRTQWLTPYFKILLTSVLHCSVTLSYINSHSESWFSSWANSVRLSFIIYIFILAKIQNCLWLDWIKRKLQTLSQFQLVQLLKIPISFFFSMKLKKFFFLLLLAVFMCP